MNKEIFERVANAYVDYCADYYDSAFVDTPDGFDTPSGFLNDFKSWLYNNGGDDYMTDGDGMTEDEFVQWCNDVEHVIEYFDEVGVEEIEEGVYIPVLK